MKRWLVYGLALPLVAAAARAGASVSIAVGWDGLLEASEAAALVTPLESRCLWEEGRIYTYTRVRVDRVLAGEPGRGGEAWVRTMGGVVGRVGQIVEGEAVLAPERPSLLFLHTAATDPAVYEVTARGQGQFPFVSAARLVRSGASGVLVRPRAPDAAADRIDGRAVDDVAREVAGSWERAHEK